jgi:hypothetical protein
MRFRVTVAVALTCLGFAPCPLVNSDELSEDEVVAYKDAWSAAVDRTTPEGYLYEELRRCAGCHETAKDAAGNSTHRNAIGITGDPSSPTVTGKGWLSGGHGRSQSKGAKGKGATHHNPHIVGCHERTL